MSELTALHNAIVTTISEKMPVLRLAKAYDPTTRDSIATPAVLIELTEMTPEASSGDGRMWLKLEFVAHCILSVKTADVELEIRNFAAQVMQVVSRQRWGLDLVKPPADLSAFPASFSPAERGYESWVVTWSQSVAVGESLFDSLDFLPERVFVGVSPNVGAEHVDDYVEITGE